MVCYIYDYNTVIAHTMVSRTDASMVKAFKEVIGYFDSKGCKPGFNMIDSACSKTVKEVLSASQDIDIRVAPRNHCVNAAEKVIATFKEHFIAVFPTLNNNCPLQACGEFLEKVQGRDTAYQHASLAHPTLAGQLAGLDLGEKMILEAGNIFQWDMERWAVQETVNIWENRIIENLYIRGPPSGEIRVMHLFFQMIYLNVYNNNADIIYEMTNTSCVQT